MQICQTPRLLPPRSTIGERLRKLERAQEATRRLDQRQGIALAVALPTIGLLFMQLRNLELTARRQGHRTQLLFETVERLQERIGPEEVVE